MTEGVLQKISEVDHRLSLHEATCLEQSKANGVALVALQDGHKVIIARLDGLNAAGWRLVGAVLLPLVGLFAWLFVQVWPTHSEGAYTAADAARDRAEIEARAAARDQAMLQAIQRMSK